MVKARQKGGEDYEKEREGEFIVERRMEMENGGERRCL